jgi:hypothetical protein
MSQLRLVLLDFAAVPCWVMFLEEVVGARCAARDVKVDMIGLLECGMEAIVVQCEY